MCSTRDNTLILGLFKKCFITSILHFASSYFTILIIIDYDGFQVANCKKSYISLDGLHEYPIYNYIYIIYNILLSYIIMFSHYNNY